MSDIHIWKTSNLAESENEVSTEPLKLDSGNASFGDGEELMAVHKLVELLDGLNDGEVLVVTRELF